MAAKQGYCFCCCKESVICYNSDMVHHCISEKGFTLAEVLITLGIIGVVAAMTIPNVINHYRDRQILSQFNAAVSLFSNAFTQMANDNGGELTNLFGFYNDFRHLGEDFYAQYFKLLKMCIPYGSYKNCVPYKFYALNRKTETQEVCGTYSHVGILENGMIFCLSMPNGREGGWENRFSLAVDFNGAKAPNALGYDVFKFFISNSGVVRARDIYDDCSCDIKGNGGRNGFRCSRWIQKYQNVDYLYHSYPNWADEWRD